MAGISNFISRMITIAIIFLVGIPILRFISNSFYNGSQLQQFKVSNDDEDIEDVLERVEEETFSETKEDRRRFRKKRNEI